MTYKKLNEIDVVRIYRLATEVNITYEKIADIFDVSRETVSAIVRGKNWQHLNLKAVIQPRTKGVKAQTKLRREDAIEILKLKNSEMTQQEIAEQFGVSRSLVNAIHNGYVWKALAD